MAYAVEFQDIYETMCGFLESWAQVPWIEDAFEEGSFCGEALKEMMEAYERLRDRLGVTDADDDVETILACSAEIQKELCRRMFQYGQEYDQHLKDDFDPAMRLYAEMAEREESRRGRYFI